VSSQELKWQWVPEGVFGYPAGAEIAVIPGYYRGTMHRWPPKARTPLQMRDSAWGAILISGKMRLVTDGHGDGVVLGPGSGFSLHPGNGRGTVYSLECLEREACVFFGEDAGTKNLVRPFMGTVLESEWYSPLIYDFATVEWRRQGSGAPAGAQRADRIEPPVSPFPGTSLLSWVRGSEAVRKTSTLTGAVGVVLDGTLSVTVNGERSKSLGPGSFFALLGRARYFRTCETPKCVFAADD
jgi:hypothetical protein